MTTRFLCIDDEDPAQLDALLDRLRRSGGLEITLASPLTFDAEVLRVSSSAADGLILDLRLDQVPSIGGERVGYRAGSLAQEIRTRMTERKIRSCPIVLWSIDSKLRESYWKDLTTHDLFDKIYYKNQIVSSTSRIATELVALAEGYKSIGVLLQKRNRQLAVLGLGSAEAASIDPRIRERFLDGERTPVHEYARFILRDLIDVPGPLVDELLLASRLGIDHTRSDDWGSLMDELSQVAGYTGPFCGAWRRWWWFRVEAWWDQMPNRPGPLRQTRAIDRVNFLRDTCNYAALTPAVPIQSTYSDRFWVVCSALEQPLDPVEGVLLEQDDIQPWQERKYASLFAVLERKTKAKKLRIHALERSRIQDIVRRSDDAKA